MKKPFKEESILKKFRMLSSLSLIFLAFIIYVNTCFAGDKEKEKRIKLELEVINLAKEFNDKEVIIICYYHLIELGYNDTLAYSEILNAYFELTEYQKCYLLCKKINTAYSDNLFILDIYAKTCELLERFSESELLYSKLYAFTNDSYYAYLKANSQFRLGRFMECGKYLETVILNTDCSKQYISFTKEDKTEQEVVIIAALYNLRGVVYEAEQNKNAALEAYTQALNLQSDFQLAKINLERLSKSQ